MDYDFVFSERAAEYYFATKTYPSVLTNELRTAAEVVNAKPGDVVLNIPGACVDISPHLAAGVVYRPYETNSGFAKLTETPFVSSFGTIPEADASVDKILSLASLHHATASERAEFYKEALRVLRPKGNLVVGDVMAGTAQDRFLNTFVKSYNGHNGLFWSPADAASMLGFSVSVEVKKYRWEFSGKEEMAVFCKNLFGLKSASDKEILDGLSHYLAADETGFDWSLIFFVATKGE